MCVRSEVRVIVIQWLPIIFLVRVNALHSCVMSHSDESPAVLKRRRAVIQASCTRIKSYVDANASVTPTVAAQLEERKVRLDRCWSDYEGVQMPLELHDESESNHRLIFEETFYSAAAKIRELIMPAFSYATASSPSSMPNARGIPDSGAHIRLPKFNLPIFSGKYDEWFPFFDSFHATIHTNTSISDVQKLQYLKAALVGDAWNVIGSLEISAINYEVAWGLLKGRYNNKRIIIQNHIKAITDLPSLSKENAAELRQIADGVMRHVQALAALKRPTEHWDDLLVHILSDKLDSVTLREWQSSISTADIPTFKQFCEFITQRCHVLEATSRTNSVPTKGYNTRSQINMKRQSTHVATIKSRCSFCRAEHSIYQYKDFLALTVPQRISEIKKRKICTNCIRSTAHNSNNCSSGNCRVCKSKHNTLLHTTNVYYAQGNVSSGFLK